MKPIDIIEDLRLEVTASIDSREQGYVDDLFRKATDALISSSTASVPSKKQILELILQYHEFSGIPFPIDERPLEFVKQFKKWEAKEPQWPIESKAPVRETGDHRAYWYNLGRADAIKAWKDAQKGLV